FCSLGFAELRLADFKSHAACGPLCDFPGLDGLAIILRRERGVLRFRLPDSCSFIGYLAAY
ncbi:MAG TPA: hypothetical protein VFF39_02345, partial [Verrucomicrobiae bacterium]|nr:hypothetical protein [Verrucomicrobiae bacterium]